MSENKEVVPATETETSIGTLFPMVVSEDHSVMDSLKESLANESVTRRELFTVIPNPKGEAEWTIKLPTGKKIFEKLEGVILHIGNERVYYEQAYGTGDKMPPDCISVDGVLGVGSPGGKCIDCELAAFGPNNEAPMCSQKKPLHLLIPEVNPKMPVVINATGPSFPNIKAFTLSLMQFGINIYDVKVKLTLTVKKTKNNKDASLICFEPDGNLKEDDPVGYEKFKAYRDGLIKYLDPKYREVQADANTD